MLKNELDNIQGAFTKYLLCFFIHLIFVQQKTLFLLLIIIYCIFTLLYSSQRHMAIPLSQTLHSTHNFETDLAQTKELSSFLFMNIFVPTDMLTGLYNFSIYWFQWGTFCFWSPLYCSLIQHVKKKYSSRLLFPVRTLHPHQECTHGCCKGADIYFSVYFNLSTMYNRIIISCASSDVELPTGTYWHYYMYSCHIYRSLTEFK